MSSCSLILIKTGLDRGTLSPNAGIQPIQGAHSQHRLMSFCEGCDLSLSIKRSFTKNKFIAAVAYIYQVCVPTHFFFKKRMPSEHSC